MKIEEEMGVKIIFPSSRNEDHISKIFFNLSIIHPPDVYALILFLSFQSLKVDQWTV